MKERKLFGMPVITCNNIQNGFALKQDYEVSFSVGISGQCPLCGCLGKKDEKCGNDGELIVERFDIYNPLLGGRK